jgi:hypothetical protein
VIEKFFSVAGGFQQRAALKIFLAGSADNNGCLFLLDSLLPFNLFYAQIISADSS